MAVQSDLTAAINQIAAERGIETDQVLTAVADAIKAGFLSNYEVEDQIVIEVEIDPDAGEIGVYQVYKIVEDVIDEHKELTLEQGKDYDETAEIGDELRLDVTPEGDFGRVAAQAAKQAIMQQVRMVEKETQLKAYQDRIGEVEYAVVQRMEGDKVIWEIGKTTAIMPDEERIKNEFYKSGNRHKVLIKEITEDENGKTMIVSRAAPEFLEALFELEVPELTSESIEIKKIAREAGSRSKIAVSSNVEGIDPIGSFVGQRGMRISAVMNELRFGSREEKIDIISWSEDTKTFIANAISPAQSENVEIIDEEAKKAKITVSDDQLSLAIGKEGQNVRLAAKLTGWMLDIVSEGGAKLDDVLEGKVDAEEISRKAREAMEPEAEGEAAQTTGGKADTATGINTEFEEKDEPKADKQETAAEEPAGTEEK
ncbi:MAG: transcription termination factor NusA [Candidatus Dojkabacteria bacterium]